MEGDSEDTGGSLARPDFVMITSLELTEGRENADVLS